MSLNTPIRINELAKELKMTNKEVIEKLEAISITGKTHSSTLTPDQVRRLKDFISAGSVKTVKKPKAFVVKKAKTAEPEETIEKPKEEPQVKIEKPQRPQIEVVKQPKSRLEIVRRAPQRPAASETTEKKPVKREGAKFPPRSEKSERPQSGERPKRPFQSREGQPQREGGRPGSFKKTGEKPQRSEADAASSERKPIQRHIISQDIYDNKGAGRRRPDGKKKQRLKNIKNVPKKKTKLNKLRKLS